jgi:hypothetical protein
MVLGKVFQLSETSINSYDISFMYKLPWYNCHIVECGIKHHTSHPLFTKAYTYLPIYLHFYLCIWTYTCAEREILYNTHQEKDIWKSIVTLIYRELPALGRKIDIFKLTYRCVIPPHTGLCPLLKYYPHINSYVPYCSVKPPQKELSLHIQSCNLFPT